MHTHHTCTCEDIDGGLVGNQASEMYTMTTVLADQHWLAANVLSLVFRLSCY